MSESSTDVVFEHTIGLSDVEELGLEVDDALGSFYDAGLGTTVQETGVSERDIRQWIERDLISKGGFRLQTLEGPDAKNGDQVLAALQDAHLLRAEDRGTRFYELAHDRLVEPIQKSNKRWREDHFSPIEEFADAWSAADRSPGRLIAGEQLKEVDDWASTHRDDLRELDKEYLKACKRAESRAKTIRRLLVVVALLLLVAVVALLVAWRATNTANEAKENATREKEKALQAAAEATAAQLAARSRALQNDDPALALAVAAESTTVTAPPASDAFASVAAARAAFGERVWQPFGESIPEPGIREVVVSPDGTLIATGKWCAEPADDGRCPSTIVVRRTADPTDEPAELTGHTDRIWELAFAVDGRLASASADGTARLWDPTTGEAVGLPLDHSELMDDPDVVVNTVAFDPTDASRLATGDSTGRVWLWDLSEDPPAPTELVRRSSQRPGSVFDVAFRPDGRILASAEESGAAVLWDVGPVEDDVSRNEDITRLEYPLPPGVESREQASRVAFAPEPTAECPSSGSAGCIDLLVVAHTGGDMWRWEVPNSGTPRAIRMPGHTEDVRGLDFGPPRAGPRGNSALLASSSGDGSIRLRSFTRLNDESADDGSLEVLLVGDPLDEHGEFVSDVSLVPGGDRLYSTSTDGTMRVWAVPVDTGVVTLVDLREGPGGCAGVECFVASVAFSPDRKMLGAAGFDGRVRLWELGEGAEAKPGEVLSEEGKMYALAFGDDGALVAGGHGRVWLWDRPGAGGDGEVLWEAEQVAAWEAGDLEEKNVPAVKAVAIDPRTGLAASADECGVVRLWDPAMSAADRELGVLSLHPEASPLLGTANDCAPVPKDCLKDADYCLSVDALTFGDGLLFVGDESGRVWEVPVDRGGFGTPGDPRQVHEEGREGNVRSIALSADGSQIASGSRDQTVALSGLTEEQPDALLLDGHSGGVGGVAFNRDAYLGSASNDGTIRLWWFDVESAGRVQVPKTGQPLPESDACLATGECFVLAIAFSADGALMAVGTSEGKVYLWEDPASPEVACRLAAGFVTAEQLEEETGRDLEVCDRWLR